MAVNQKDINLHGDVNKKENRLDRTNIAPITDSITEQSANSNDEISQLLRKFDIKAVELFDTSPPLKNAYSFLKKGKETNNEKFAIECFKNAHQTLNIADVPLRVAPPLKYWEEEDIEGALGACLRINTRACINEMADKNIDTDPLTACQLYSMIGAHNEINKVIEHILTKESEYAGISRSMSLAVEISVEYNINLSQLLEEKGLTNKLSLATVKTLLYKARDGNEHEKRAAFEKAIRACDKEELRELGFNLMRAGEYKLGFTLEKIAGVSTDPRLESIAEDIANFKKENTYEAIKKRIGLDDKFDELLKDMKRTNNKLDEMLKKTFNSNH